jgi:fatty acid desaturase
MNANAQQMQLDEPAERTWTDVYGVGARGRPLTAKEFARVSPGRAVLETLATWLGIAALIAGFAAIRQAWLFPIVFVIIAAQQYALLILMHDGFHSLLHPNRRVNDFIGAWLIGAPFGSSYWGSKEFHLEHHRKLGEVGDPEFFLHSAGSPRHKRSLAAFTKHFALLVLGEQFLYTHIGNHPEQAERTLRDKAKGLLVLAPVVLVQMAFLAAFTVAGVWPLYFALWLAPLLTLVVLLNALRAFCDHANLTACAAVRLNASCRTSAIRWNVSSCHRST